MTRHPPASTYPRLTARVEPLLPPIRESCLAGVHSTRSGCSRARGRGGFRPDLTTAETKNKTPAALPLFLP